MPYSINHCDFFNVRAEGPRRALRRIRPYRHKSSAVRSLLNDIPGIGEARRNALLEHFGSLQKIRAASIEGLAAAPAMNRALAGEMQEYLQVLLKAE